MGVTIHYAGTLRDQNSYDQLIAAAEAFAAREGWRMEPIRKANATLSRFIDDQERVYEGPTAGLIIFPHERAEPVELEFDENLFAQGYTKTQFAPAYWETGNLSYGTEVERPLAVVMIGGLITSTLFTLLALPTFYMLVHQLRDRIQHRRHAAHETTEVTP